MANVFASRDAEHIVPAGVYRAVCCDVIDVPTLPTDRTREPRIKLYWQLERAELPRSCVFGQRYARVMHERSILRRQVQAWLGRRFSEKEANSFDFESLIGRNCILCVVNDVKDSHRFANVMSISMAPPNQPALRIDPAYVRFQNRRNDAAPDPEAA